MEGMLHTSRSSTSTGASCNTLSAKSKVALVTPQPVTWQMSPLFTG